MNSETLITSSGIIRNRSKPRCGIISAYSLHSSVFDDIHEGIDLGWEDFVEDLRARGIEEDSQAWYKETDSFESNGQILFGDAWFKIETGKDAGKYDIDKSKNLAASYSRDSGNVCVEFSKHTKLTANTSPCYVMADGSGPCGDLDSPGDAVLAFTLPFEYFEREE